MATSSKRTNQVSRATKSGDTNSYKDRGVGVDTSSYKEGYAAGSSSVFSLYNVRQAHHVDVRPRLGKTDSGTHKSQLRPIEWTEDIGFTSAAEFRRRSDPCDIKHPEVRLHSALMLERMTFQKTHYKCTGPSPAFMVEQSLLKGPSFASEWASKWKNGRFDWAGVERLDPVIDQNASLEFKDYNSTYSPYFFIFWKEEVDDYLHMFGGRPYEDEETLEQLEEEIAAMSEELNPSGDFSVPDEVTYCPTSSNAFEGSLKTKPEWEIEFDSPHRDGISDHLEFLRGQAMKRPSETRDIGTLSPESMRLHRTIMYPMQKACREIPDCVYGRDQEFIKNRVRSLGERNFYFYMRDYTKSGMTMPRRVRSAIIRGFYRRNPALARRYDFAFEREVLFVRENKHLVQRLPDTGTPLGMFVEGFTLLQYAVDRIIQRTLGCSIDFEATNDDMVVGSRDEDLIRNYCNQDSIIQTDLGMLVKASKSGLSHHRFFFCEEYWDGDYIMSKEVLTALSILGAKYAINIVHAKELVNSILLMLPYISDIVRKAITEVQTCFEPEFSDQEHQWPYLFGGWWPTYRDGLDVSIQWRNGDLVADAAYWACRERPHKNHVLKPHATMAYSRFKDISLISVPTNQADYISLIPLFGSKGALADYYSLLSRNPAGLKRQYHSLFVARQRKFTRIMNGKIEMEDVLHGYLRRHPNSVILMGMRGVRYSEPIGEIYDPRIGLTTTTGEAKLSSLACLGIIEYPGLQKISKSESMMHRIGFTEELRYHELKVGERGSSTFAINTHLRGLESFQTTHGKVIEAVDHDDEPSDITKRWLWTPELPLQWVFRLSVYSRRLPNRYISARTGEFWQKFIQGRWKPPEDWGLAPDPTVEPPRDTSSFEVVLRDYIRSLLDGGNLEIQARIVPYGALPNSTPVHSDRTDRGLDHETRGLIEISTGSYADPGLIATTIWDESDDGGESYDWFLG